MAYRGPGRPAKQRGGTLGPTSHRPTQQPVFNYSSNDDLSLFDVDDDAPHTTLHSPPRSQSTWQSQSPRSQSTWQSPPDTHRPQSKKGLSFSDSEIKTLLFGIYLGLERDGVYENFKQVHGAERPKASVLAKDKTMRHRLLQTTAGKSDHYQEYTPPKEETVDFPQKAYDFMRPELITDGGEIPRYFFVVFKEQHFSIKMGANGNTIQVEYVKFAPSFPKTSYPDDDLPASQLEVVESAPLGTPWFSVACVNVVSLRFEIPSDMEIIGSLENSHWKGIEVKYRSQVPIKNDDADPFKMF